MSGRQACKCTQQTQPMAIWLQVLCLWHLPPSKRVSHCSMPTASMTCILSWPSSNNAHSKQQLCHAEVFAAKASQFAGVGTVDEQLLLSNTQYTLILSVASKAQAMQCSVVILIDDALQDISWKHFCCKRRSTVTLCEVGSSYTARLTCS